MLGVMRLILDREAGSVRGDDDFFSVAKTIPLVADIVNTIVGQCDAACRPTFDAKGCYTLVDCVQSILYCIPALLARSWWDGDSSTRGIGNRCIETGIKERRTDLYKLPTAIELA